MRTACHERDARRGEGEALLFVIVAHILRFPGTEDLDEGLLGVHNAVGMRVTQFIGEDGVQLGAVAGLHRGHTGFVSGFDRYKRRRVLGEGLKREKKGEGS